MANNMIGIFPEMVVTLHNTSIRMYYIYIYKYVYRIFREREYAPFYGSCTILTNLEHTLEKIHSSLHSRDVPSVHLEHQVCNVSNSQVMPKLIDVFQDYLETYMTGPQSTSSTSQFKTMKTFPYNEICTGYTKI